jgi:hypothetical protein
VALVVGPGGEELDVGAHRVHRGHIAGGGGGDRVVADFRLGEVVAAVGEQVSAESVQRVRRKEVGVGVDDHGAFLSM